MAGGDTSHGAETCWAFAFAFAFGGDTSHGAKFVWVFAFAFASGVDTSHGAETVMGLTLLLILRLYAR